MSGCGDYKISQKEIPNSEASNFGKRNQGTWEPVALFLLPHSDHQLTNAIGKDRKDNTPSTLLFSSKPRDHFFPCTICVQDYQRINHLRHSFSSMHHAGKSGGQSRCCTWGVVCISYFLVRPGHFETLGTCLERTNLVRQGSLTCLAWEACMGTGAPLSQHLRTWQTHLVKPLTAPFQKFPRG